MGEAVKAAAKAPVANRENKAPKTQKTELSHSRDSPVEQVLFLQRTIGNRAVERLIKSGNLRAKLRISRPGDVYEQEADRVAEQVLLMPEPRISKETKVSNHTQNNPIQRRCPRCIKEHQPKKEEEEKVLQKKEASDSTPEATPELESNISSIRGGGQPLPESVRAFYEPRFGHDFSGVRMHTDAKAAEAARAVDARAFTVGRDMVFGEGEFKPETGGGKKLLAHELTHIIQQGVSSTNNFDSSGNGHSLQRKEDLQPQASEAKGQKPVGDMLRNEAKEDAQKIKKIFQDNTILGPFNQRDIMGIIEKWAKKSTDTGTKLTPFDYLIAALRATTFEVGTLVKQYTSAFDQIFHRMSSDRVEQFKGWMQTLARVFKDEKAIEEVSLTGEFKEGKWKKTAEEFWGAKFKSMGEFLNSIGTPAIIQNLLGGLVGVIQGFAELLVELIEGVWSLVEAADHILSTILYFITGAAEGAGLNFLKKLPLVGKVFDPETYKERYEATINFFKAAGAALQNPRQILDGIKASAIKAWDETLDEYNKADDFNKSRIIAKGVVKVGMAVGGFIKSLPGLAKSAVKLGKTLEKGVVKVGKTIGKAAVTARKIIDEALQGAIKIGRNIFRGVWKVVEETIEGGKKKLRYFFKKSKNEVFEEISEDLAKTCLDCNSPCKKTKFAKNIEEIEKNRKNPMKGSTRGTRREPFADDPEFHESIKELEDVPGAKRIEQPEDIDYDQPTLPEDRPEGNLFNKTAKEIDEANARRERGNTFNTEREGAYPHNEVDIESPFEKGKRYRLDSYDPGHEIVSRKYPEGEILDTERATKYIAELADNYPPGARIADTPKNRLAGLAGKKLSGQPILEVPVLLEDVPQEVLEFAERALVIIRDSTGKIYR